MAGPPPSDQLQNPTWSAQAQRKGPHGQPDREAARQALPGSLACGRRVALRAPQRPSSDNRIDWIIPCPAATYEKNGNKTQASISLNKLTKRRTRGGGRARRRQQDPQGLEMACAARCGRRSPPERIGGFVCCSAIDRTRARGSPRSSTPTLTGPASWCWRCPGEASQWPSRWPVGCERRSTSSSFASSVSRVTRSSQWGPSRRAVSACSTQTSLRRSGSRRRRSRISKRWSAQSWSAESACIAGTDLRSTSAVEWPSS